MTAVCLLLLQVIAALPLLAQLKPTDNTDTRVLGGPVMKDTAGVNEALRLAASQRESAPANAKQLYRQAWQASKALHYNNGIARSLQGLGSCYSYENEEEKAVAYARLALPYCEDNTNGHELTAQLYLLLSETYYYKGRYDSCAYYRYAALGELEANNIRNPHMQMKVYCSILQFWLNAHEDISNDPHIRQVMDQIGLLEKQALASGDSSLLMNIYFYKGGYFNNIAQNDSARYYCNRNLQMAHALKTGPSIPVGTLLNIAITWLEDKQPAKAIEYIRLAMNEMPLAARATNRQLLFAQIFLGEAYCAQKAYDKAIAITAPALARADSLHITHITDRAHKTLADAFEATGQYKQAALHRRLYTVMRDSLMKAEKLELVYNVEMKYRIADKNKELAQKELAIARNESRLKTKNFWIGGISAGLVLISLLSVLLYRNNRHKQTLQEEKIRNLRQEVQITSLHALIAGEEKERSRIARELHDGMGGTLASIRTRVSAIFRRHATTDVTNDFLEVMQLLEEASADLRKTAHNLMPEILLNEGLARASLLFCERVHKGHQLKINAGIWGKVQRLPGDLELTAYRIIQELVHNILKHAKATEATVQIVFHDSQLCITVEDNGTGMAAGAGEQSGGMGLQTIRERVQMMNGQIDIASTPGQGTSIYIELGISAITQNTADI
jgi:signal transduction histidine kinase